MVDKENIIIEKAIVHILDPGDTGFIPSSKCLDPKINIKALDLIRKHILETANNPEIKKAKFINKSHDLKDNIVCKNCNIAIKIGKKFIEASEIIAGYLFKILQTKNLSNCDLVICLYHIDKEPKEKFIAILKLELSHGLRNKVVKTSSGANVISFEMDNTFALEMLQKAAIVHLYNSQNPYDLLVIDHQARSTSKFGVAIYFLDNFLKSETEIDDRYLTRLLYENLVDIENKFWKNGNIVYAKNTRKLLPIICSSRSFNLPAWMASLSFSKTLQKKINSMIRPQLRGRAFSIHKASLENYCEKIKYQGSNDLIIEIDGKYIGNLKLAKKRVKKAGKRVTHPPVSITIDTKNLSRVKFN